MTSCGVCQSAISSDSFVIRSGTVHVHFLEEIPTVGMHYEDRDRLAEECWRRMASALEKEHGVVSTLEAGRRERARRSAATTLVES